MENSTVTYFLSMSPLPAENVVLLATDDETVSGDPADSAVTSLSRVPARENVEHKAIIKMLYQ